MLEPNKDLEQIFENAVHLANSNDHEYITLEHFLYSMLNNNSFSEILTTFGTNVESLKQDLENYLQGKTQKINCPKKKEEISTPFEKIKMSAVRKSIAENLSKSFLCLFVFLVFLFLLVLGIYILTRKLNN